jgi:hypothetical protein
MCTRQGRRAFLDGIRRSLAMPLARSSVPGSVLRLTCCLALCCCLAGGARGAAGQVAGQKEVVVVCSFDSELAAYRTGIPALQRAMRAASPEHLWRPTEPGSRPCRGPCGLPRQSTSGFPWRRWPA